jgi:hypothetical protein
MDSKIKDLLMLVALPVFLVVYVCIILYTTAWVGAVLNAGYFTSAVPVIMLLPLIAFAIRLEDKRRKELLEPKLKSGEFTPIQNMEKTVDEYRSMFDEEENKDEEQ